MDNLNDIITQATAAIPAEYFRLPIDGDEPRQRERVYCYELFFRMRSNWPKGCKYVLSGEVDKSGHPYLGEGKRKPDLLVHIPGSSANLAVIEVKSTASLIDGLDKDLASLRYFLDGGGNQEAKYERAIYLVYGAAPDFILNRLKARGVSPEQFEGIEVWIHSDVGISAIRIPDADVAGHLTRA